MDLDMDSSPDGRRRGERGPRRPPSSRTEFDDRYGGTVGQDSRSVASAYTYCNAKTFLYEFASHGALRACSRIR